MSTSIPSLLADKLDTSDEQAQKLLIAMLREVKKRARREGVRLPELGTFREANGQITFEPSPSLARAVNHRFEGLESEDLATAPEDDGDDEDDDGPTTITLGYQDSSWSPLDSEASDGGDDDDDGADTEEFQVPAADDAADTEELQAQDAEPDESSEPSHSEPVADSEGSETNTEELYPLVEDVPDGASESDPDSEQTRAEERDTLSGIWNDDEDDEDEVWEPEEENLNEPSGEPDPFTESKSEHIATAEPEPESARAASSPHPDAQPTSEVRIEPEAREAVSPESSSSDSADEGSTGARVFVGLLVLLLLGGAGWYVLGQRGRVQTPQATFAQLKTQIQPHLKTLSAKDITKNIPLIGATSQSPASDADGASTAAAVPANAETREQSTSSSEGETAPSSADAASSDGSSTTAPEPTENPPTSEGQAGTPRALNPAEGGWTIIVASRAERGAAESLVENYRTVFSAQGVAVGMLTGQVNDQTRYRIGVGQFSSRSEARTFLDEAGSKLPKGAWPLRL